MKDTIHLLTQLQNIDSAQDTIENKKGSLPKELDKLKTQLQSLENELENCKNEITQQKKFIAQHKEASKKATELIARHNQEHLHASNNTEEYDNITREIALQELDIKLAKKKIKTSQIALATHNERIEELQQLIQENKETTKGKKVALEEIDEKTHEEETKLREQRIEVIQKIQDTNLLEKYESLRKRLSLVVARVIDEACTGCFITVPIQRQIKIREGKKIFLCENCDRMLVQAEKAPPKEEKKIPKRRARSTKKTSL